MIDEAIDDKNVLDFHVDYINTGEFESYEALREQISDFRLEEQEEQPSTLRRKIERQVYEMSDLAVEKEARNKKLLFYHDETHIPRVVEEILDHWAEQSQAKFFNAILTVALKHRVIAYYEEFQKQLKERDDIHLNVAMTFSFGTDADVDPTDPTIIQSMFEDYASFTGIEYAYGDKRRGEEAYYDDVVERATRGGSGRNPRNIDLVIVADQLLTGYDSKYINTLYVDRTLRLQTLIQAYSRTNRVYGKDKEFGSIVNFQFPRITEQMVNDALILYGSGGKNSPALVEPYKQAVDKLRNRIEELKATLLDPTEWQDLESNEEAKKEFIEVFKEANNQLNTVRQYYEFEWDDEAFGITEDQWMRYTGAYQNIRRDEKIEDEELPVMPLSEAKLVGTQKIDAHYIIQLIDEKSQSTQGKQTVDTETLRLIYNNIKELSNLGEHDQAELLKQFVQEEVEPGHLESNVHIDDAFEEWKANKLRKEVYELSQDWGFDEVIFSQAVEVYSVSKPDDVPFR